MRLTDLFLGRTELPQQSAVSEATQAGNTAAINKMIQSLIPGQTLQGEIVSKNGSQVEIRVDDQVLLKAALERDMNLEVGNLMSFQVKNNGKALTLSPLFANTATDNTAFKALDMAGLPVNEKSVAMTRQMMNEGMPIDKNHLQAMYREINQYNDHTIEDIVDLHKLDMPVNKENLEQLQAYKETAYQFEQGVSQVAEHLPDTLQQIATQSGNEKAAQVLLDMWELVESTEETAEGTQQDVNHVVGEQKSPESAESIQKNETQIQTTDMTSADLPKFASGLPEPMNVSQAETKVLNEANTTLQQGNTVNDIGKNPEGIVFSKDSLEAQENEIAPQRGITISEQVQVEKEEGITENQTVKTFIPEEKISQFIEKTISEGQPDKLEKLLNNKELVDLLKDKLISQNKITPREVADKEQVKEFYNKMDRTLSGMERILEQAGAKNTPTFTEVKTLNQNLDFLNQINQTYQFVQLPLRLSNSSAHGDLYVYSNKKNLASQDGKVSAYLHLDMEHLGPVGVYVTLENSKVDTKFTLANDEMLDFIEAHMDQLTSRLEKRGYQMTYSLSKDEKVAGKEGIQPILPHEENGRLLQEFAFDVRA